MYFLREATQPPVCIGSTRRGTWEHKKYFTREMQDTAHPRCRTETQHGLPGIEFGFLRTQVRVRCPFREETKLHKVTVLTDLSGNREFDVTTVANQVKRRRGSQINAKGSQINARKLRKFAGVSTIFCDQASWFLYGLQNAVSNNLSAENLSGTIKTCILFSCNSWCVPYRHTQRWGLRAAL